MVAADGALDSVLTLFSLEPSIDRLSVISKVPPLAKLIELYLPEAIPLTSPSTCSPLSTKVPSDTLAITRFPLGASASVPATNETDLASDKSKVAFLPETAIVPLVDFAADKVTLALASFKEEATYHCQ